MPPTFIAKTTNMIKPFRSVPFNYCNHPESAPPWQKANAFAHLGELSTKTGRLMDTLGNYKAFEIAMIHYTKAILTIVSIRIIWPFPILNSEKPTPLSDNWTPL